MNLIESIHSVDRNLTLVLVELSIQAYKAFNHENPVSPNTQALSAPQGLELIASWTGVDSIFHHEKSEELYGLAFRSLSDPGDYYFAFRGTASLLDGVDDMGAELTDFQAYDSTLQLPDNLKVESGFFDVYSVGDGETHSMQKQLFALIDDLLSSEPSIEHLYVTGHSLGSALSELFTLDLMLSRPDIPISTINFACPRVGNSDFVDFYEKTTAAARSGTTQTLRVQNTFDLVPCVPPELLGYAHLPSAYLISFHPHTMLGKLDYLENHSAHNYQAVLECAAASDSGICTNKELSVTASNIQVCSIKPETGGIFDLVHMDR